MPPIAYAETNLLMSYATGRDHAADDLVLGRIPNVELAIPSICFMEALSTFEGMKKGHDRFMHELQNKIQDCERGVVWADREERLKQIARGAVEVQTTFDRFRVRLDEAIHSLAPHVRLIEISASILDRSVAQRLIDDTTDNLILTTILDDAALRPETREPAFLSENTRDFRDNLDARKALEDAGIRFFPRADALIGWLGSLRTEPSI